MNIFENVKNYKNKKLLYFLAYSAIFATIFAFGFISLYASGKTLLASDDGRTQHLPALIHMSEWLREYAANAVKGEFMPRLFDFRIGLGEDLLTSLKVNSTPISPLNLLSAFVPSRSMEGYYNFVVIMRMYFAGLAFSFFCFDISGALDWSVLLGSMIYTFSGWSVFTACRHPAFLLAIIYLPMLTAGLDRILNEKKSWLFILFVFMSALSGFYFLYMETIFLFIYALLRVHHLYPTQYFTNVLKKGFSAAICYIAGVCVAAPVFLTGIIASFSATRQGHIQMDSLLLFDSDIYTSFFLHCISGNGSWIRLGLAAVTLIAAVLLLFKKSAEKKYLLTGLIITLALYLIPFGGYMMNGFGYISARWTFIAVFVIASITTYILRDLRDLTYAELFACAFAMVIYMIPALFSNRYRGRYTMTASLFLALSFICLAYRSVKTSSYKKGKKISRDSFSTPAGALTSSPVNPVKIISLIIVIALNLIINTNDKTNGKYGILSGELMKRGAAMDDYANVMRSADYITDESFYREDPLPSIVGHNFGMVRDYHGISLYFSIINGNYVSAMLEHSNFQQDFINAIQGFDNRVILTTLASVKYLPAKSGQFGYVPFGYKMAYNDGASYVFENEYALPLGYTYTRSISRSAYMNLEPIQKQDAIAQAVVLPDGFENTGISELEINTVPIDNLIVEAKDLRWDKGILDIYKDNAELTLRLNGLPDSETYIELIGLDNDERLSSLIRVASKNFVKSQMQRYWRDSYYFGKHDYLANIGYSISPQEAVTIVFVTNGKYKLSDIRAYCLPMTNYPKYAKTLREDIMENTIVGVNRVSGEIDLLEDKFLVLSIPYSPGWSAWVDGQRQELLQANTMFMALPLKAGHHDIELSYLTPGMKTSLALIAAGLILSVFLIINERGKSFPV